MDQDTRSPEQIKIDQMQEKLRKYYLAIPMPIMMDPRLTLADKVVYGRAYSFERLFESPTQTSMALGISADQVRKSKRKLEKLGLLRCTKETYYGKAFEALENFHNPLGKNHNPLGKISQPPCEIFTTENKERLKEEENNSFKDKSLKDGETPDEQDAEPLKEQKTFGNPQVNELMADWADATGFDHSKIKSERFAMAGLIKQHGYEATKALVRRVKAATRSGDPFAPQIAKASQLRGKYSKLEALVQWERRTQAKVAAEEAKKPAAVPVGLYPEFKPDPYDDIPDTPEARAQRHAKAQALREKYGFGRRAD